MHGDTDPDLSARNRVSVAFGGDGERVITGAGGDDRVREWDVSTGQQVGGDMIGHQRDVTAVAFSEDRQYIASGAQDGTVRLWDATTQRPVGRALSILQPVVDGQPATGRLYATVVAFGPKDGLVVAGLNDGTIRVWPGPTAWPSALCAKLTQVMGPPHWQGWVAKDIRYVPVCPNLPRDG
jgi:WD40 repeat protein